LWLRVLTVDTKVAPVTIPIAYNSAAERPAGVVSA
jgi:hypothetical protein